MLVELVSKGDPAEPEAKLLLVDLLERAARIRFPTMTISLSGLLE
jgi:hypothetical protein